MEANCTYGLPMLLKYVNSIFPKVDTQLKHYIDISSRVEDSVLSKQALASITHKRFHCQGGCAYALYPNVDTAGAIKFIVALQTISDYLDNLCDRAGVEDEQSFRQLHLSLLDAVDPKRKLSKYYLYYPHKYDNNYLEQLVMECREQIECLPSYNLVADTIKKYVKLYSELQTYKHLNTSIRESRMISWTDSHIGQYPSISRWEFAAATGSTLGIFVLYDAASDPSLTPDEVKAIDVAYFPWVCGLHILLDYFIDTREDTQMGDLNFTFYYNNLKQCEQRLNFFVEQSLQHCATLRYPLFHETIIKGLLSMYLSDPKASWGLNTLASRNLIKFSGKKTAFYYNVCRLLRVWKVI